DRRNSSGWFFWAPDRLGRLRFLLIPSNQSRWQQTRLDLLASSTYALGWNRAVGRRPQSRWVRRKWTSYSGVVQRIHLPAGVVGGRVALFHFGSHRVVESIHRAFRQDSADIRDKRRAWYCAVGLRLFALRIPVRRPCCVHC